MKNKVKNILSKYEKRLAMNVLQLKKMKSDAKDMDAKLKLITNMVPLTELKERTILLKEIVEDLKEIINE